MATAPAGSALVLEVLAQVREVLEPVQAADVAPGVLDQASDAVQVLDAAQAADVVVSVVAPAFLETDSRLSCRFLHRGV